MLEHPISNSLEGPHYESMSKDQFIAILESEFESMFGHVGLLLVKKVVQDYRGKGELGPVDVPILIEILVETVAGMITEKQARELKSRIRSRCGLNT